MTKGKTIFALRFGSNEKLLPSQEDLRAFLAAPKKAGAQERHDNDLAPYRELIEDLQTFSKLQSEGTPSNQSFREKMFYGLLSRSFFVNHALKSAVEEYKYHLHSLQSLDFRKPEAFIKSAEEEISRLNVKKKEDAAKHARLANMIEERKQALEALTKRWTVLADELFDIALYIRDNLSRIEKICEASIVILVDNQLRRKKEEQLIEGVKTHFKERLRDSLHQGQVTKQHLEDAKQDVATLSREISTLIREDVYSMTGLFEAVHDHAGKITHELNELIARFESRKEKDIEGKSVIFTKIEQSLVLLVSQFHFELKASTLHTETAYEAMFLEIRKEMLDHLFEVLDTDRRTLETRRSGEDRRTSDDPQIGGPERRSGMDRRSRKNRRDS